MLDKRKYILAKIDYYVYNTLVKTSRQQVLDFIRAQHVVTASDLSRAMQMTEANARHHLNILSTEGLISVVGVRRLPGKGRPVKLYGLSEQAIGHNLDNLASALLDERLRGLSAEQQLLQMKQVAETMAVRSFLDGDSARTGPETRRTYGAHLTRRLYQTVQSLNLYRYEARWEAHTQGPRLILGHCPYAALIDEQPVLCQMDRFLLQRLVGVSVQQIAKRQLDGRGARQCIFVIEQGK